MSTLQEAENLFRKVFKFRNSGSWSLPPQKLWSCEGKQWELPALQELKADLNRTKSMLNCMEPVEWRRHTAWMNRAGHVLPQVRRTANPTLLTQAWCKFFEILYEFHIADRESLRSFHLCEAPGAFVAALQHYLQDRATDWCWYGTTLNPYYEGNSTKSTVTDDRLILNTLDRWYFGRDQTGDVLSPNFVIDDFLRGTELFDLVTADGSVDCQDDPAEQEALVAPLHCAEVGLALKLLADGAHFVLKMFTFFQSSSICLLYLLNCIFEQVHVKKPVCSKPGNSEVYVICTGFQRVALSDDHLKFLSDALIGGRVCFPLRCLPPDFLAQLFNCVRYFKELQEYTITENIQLFYRSADVELSSQLKFIKNCVAALFLEKYPCKPVTEPAYGVTANPWCVTDFRGWNVVSFVERSTNKDWWRRNVDAIRKQLSLFKNLHAKQTLLHQQEHVTPEAFWITTGRPYQDVCISKFCFQPLLDLALMLGHPGRSTERSSSVDIGRASSVVVDCSRERGKRALARIVEGLRRVKSSEGLVLRFSETLSRLSTGTIFLLSSAFETTSAERPCSLDVPVWIFDGPNMQRVAATVAHLQRAVDEDEDEGRTVLEVVPLTTMCRGREFLDFLCSVNNAWLYHCASTVLSQAELQNCSSAGQKD